MKKTQLLITILAIHVVQYNPFPSILGMNVLLHSSLHIQHKWILQPRKLFLLLFLKYFFHCNNYVVKQSEHWTREFVEEGKWKAKNWKHIMIELWHWKTKNFYICWEKKSLVIANSSGVASLTLKRKVIFGFVAFKEKNWTLRHGYVEICCLLLHSSLE